MNFFKKFLIKGGILTGVIFFLHLDVFAATSSSGFQYSMLETLPGFFAQNSVMTDFPQLILAIYKFGIWTVGIAGLFMLVVGGFVYMTSAGNNAAVSSAKEIIQDALLGIVAAMAAYLVMYVINPDLTSINIAFTKTEVTETTDTSAESSGTLQNGTEGSCGGLATQKGISSQCSDASPALAGMLACVAKNLSTVTINSISDSRGYANCIPSRWGRPPCAHMKYSCHYGGKNCFGGGKSYAVDFSTRNVSAAKIMAVAKECGASVVDESSNNHVHASVGKAAGCGCI